MAHLSSEETDDGQLLLRFARLIPGLGLILALLSGCIFAGASFAVELLPDVDAAWPVVYRSAAQFVMCAAVAFVQGDSLTGIPGERVSLAICSICFVAIIPGYYAFRFMAFSDVSTISMSSPVFVAPLAYFFLGETFGAFQFLVIMVTFGGIVLITRPSFLFDFSNLVPYTPRQNVIGATLAFACALGMAGSMVSMRKCSRTPTLVMVVWFSVSSIVCGLALLTTLKYAFHLDIGNPATSHDWTWLNINALFGVIGQCSFALSLKLEEANSVALIRTFSIVFAFVLQVSFTSQPIFWTSIVGAIIVCGSVVLSCFKRISESRLNSSRDTLTEKFAPLVSSDDCDEDCKDSC